MGWRCEERRGFGNDGVWLPNLPGGESSLLNTAAVGTREEDGLAGIKKSAAGAGNDRLGG
jgi:hypothetical protein